MRLILRRRSAVGLGDDVGLLLTFGNVHMRHAVLCGVRASMNGNPQLYADLDAMTHSDVVRVF